MTERKMVSVQQVAEVAPIENADKICQYRINGWWVVDQVGKYVPGDKVYYAEIDSWIPNSLASFLSKGKEPRVYNGIPGERLRTIRLRGAYSQGLILDARDSELEIGTDVSEILGVIKWEPAPEYFAANARGNFPSFVPKTDQPRCQNFHGSREYHKYANDPNVTWEISEKLEGQSSTVTYYNGDIEVCSRNLSLKEEDNTFWNTAKKYDLPAKLMKLGRNIAIQSEQCGPGISGNIYGATDYTLHVFDIFDIDTQKYLSPVERQKLIVELGLTSVPVYNNSASIIGKSCNELLLDADGTSVMGFTGTLREGIVFKANLDDRVSFKAVSNKYLLGEK